MISAIKHNKLLSLIVFVALFIRILGTYPGYTPEFYPDEVMSYGSATDMLRHGDLNPRRFDYPAGVPLIHYLFYSTTVLPIVFANLFLLHPKLFLNFLFNRHFIEEFTVSIFGYRDISALYWSRYLNAAIATATVYAVYLVGKKLFNHIAGISGALFLAVNYRFLLSSFIALSDIPNAFFAILSFYISLLLLEKNTRKHYLLAGLSVGLSLSMKYQVFALFPFLLAHFFWVLKKRSFRYLFDKNFLFALVIILLVFYALNPYLLLNLKTAIPIIQYVAGRYGAGTNSIYFYPIYYLFYWGIGKIPFIIISLGLLLGFLKLFKKTLLVFAYVGPFFYIFVYYMHQGYIRNFTTVMPFLALLFGAFFFLLEGYLSHFSKRYAMTICLVLLVLANTVPIKDSLIAAVYYSQPLNKTVLQDWADRTLPKNVKIRIDNVSLSQSLGKNWDLIPWNHHYENSISEFSENGDKFAVLNTDWYQGWMVWYSDPIGQIIQYPGIPYFQLKNTYEGLALSEFKHYVVKEIYKPWQASGNNYLIMKVPQLPKEKGKKIASFGFDKGIEGWSYYDFSFKKGKSDMRWNADAGKNSSGSLELTGEKRNGEISRFSSPIIKARDGETYVITGFVKPGKAIPIYPRDGYLSVSFYANKDDADKEKNDLFTAVSAKVYGDGWIKETIFAQAPKETAYLRISFARYNAALMNEYLLDDISVYELNQGLNQPFLQIPYIKTTIPDDVLYPNSII